MAAVTRSQGWQAEVRTYDLDGPGICGYYLDLIALLAGLCPLTVEVQQTDGNWITSDDPVLNTLLGGYHSPLASQAELIGTHVRHRESMGEAWIINSDDLGWQVATVPNVRVNDTHVTWTDPFGKTRIVPNHRVWKSWAPDPYSPHLPHSPLRRARSELRRLKAATRNQTRAAENRLVMNGLVAFPDDGGGTRPLAASTGIDTPGIAGIDQVVDDYMALAQLAAQDDDSTAATVPFPYIGAPATYIPLGRGIDQQALAVEEKAIEGFARAVNFPATLLINGPGSSNHWNEWLVEESQRKVGLSPKLIPVAADITAFYLRPMIAKAQGVIGSWRGVPPERVRVGFDTSYLTSKPDVASQVLQAWSSGIASREEVADALGIDRMLHLPTGMAEYEHWQLATSKPGAPYADVDPDTGELVQAPDVFSGEAPPIDLSGLDAGAPTDAPPADMPPGATPPPAGPPASVPALPPGPPENTGAPAPPAQLAAVGGVPNQVVVDQALDRLYNADSALQATLTASAQACVDRAVEYVAKELIKAHPPRSAIRARLRDLPADEVWQNSDPEVRAQFNLNEMVAEQVDQCQTSDAFQGAAGAALAALVLLGLSDEDGVEFDPDLGQLVLTSLIVGFVVSKLSAGKSTAKFPSGAVRSAMAAAGGAQVAADGTLIRGGDGLPVPTKGGTAWKGNTGMTTGHNVIDVIDRRIGGGYRSEWEWVHAFLQTPATPFPPHVALDGQRFKQPADVPGGFFPGDHQGCTCVLRIRYRLNPVPTPAGMMTT